MSYPQHPTQRHSARGSVLPPVGQWASTSKARGPPADDTLIDQGIIDRMIFLMMTAHDTTSSTLATLMQLTL